MSFLGVRGSAVCSMARGGLCWLVLLLSAMAVRGQEGNTIYWTEGNKLQFGDFKGARARGDHSYVAKTASTIIPDVRCKDGCVVYKVHCVFDKSNSVMKGHNNAVLEHEQGHFDITEVVARLIRKNLRALKTSANIAGSVNTVVEAAYREGERIQTEYENATGYGYTPPAIQAAWNARIAQMLAELAAYKETEGTVRLDGPSESPSRPL